MVLTLKEYHHFTRLHLSVMYYAGLKEKMLPKSTTFEHFQQTSFDKKFPIREALYEKPNYIDLFVKENPFKLSPEDCLIIEGFKHFIKGQFWVVKYLKKYAVFLDDHYAYGVFALSDHFENVIGPNLPNMVQAVLLPYKGKIVYDGMMAYNNILFGSSIRASLNNEYNLAKAKYGIITELPISAEIKKLENSDQQTLTALMKSKSSIDYNWYEIQELLQKNPSLYNLYNQLLGKLNAKQKKKELKELGVENFHFAITQDLIIASAKSLKEVQTLVQKMVPKSKLDSIHYFKV